MKNQFGNQPSQDGTIDQQKASPGTAADKRHPGQQAAENGLLTKWKTGQSHHAEQSSQAHIAQTGSLMDEPAHDPLSKRRMPGRRLQAHGSHPTKPPVTHSFAPRVDEVPTRQQPAVSNMAWPPQAGPETYPSGLQHQPGNPNAMNTPGFSNVPPVMVQPPLAAAGSITKKRTRRIPLWTRIAIGVLTFFIVAAGGAFAYYQFTFAGSVNNITGQSAIHDGTANYPQEPTNIDPLTQRTNIVLLGSDTDGKGNDPEHGQPLAQTIIVITIDPTNNKVGMLSIPRDMQVTDSTYDAAYPNSKIDEAFEHAWQGNDAKEKAQRAAGHTMDVIEANYGIHIDHYAWVGLQGFIKVIDTIGGIDVDISHPMFDDLYPDDTGTSQDKFGYKRLSIAPGPQHLTGLEALEYVRTRHADLGGDFGRTDRQQQVLSQIKVKLTNADTITKAPALLNDLNGFLLTDLNLNQLYTFAQIARDIDINKLDRVTLTSNYAIQIKSNTRNNYGPNCALVIPKIREMFGIDNPTCLDQG
ncbi:hypothetical protein KDA_14170 [Dictyobacter alpinus]|uniref:Cell envelope-related transcriptional attenuator domain-containing protein n=1 Tax=Dictyobacter alpinus TaxID=2014873 RepID=A0A402B3L0_9CHLR|nr:LCP family protein [Dictyobacter alpinus]GCE25933.1 hypothetical protein KDA_14170 [Dictyobacter alpinus]